MTIASTHTGPFTPACSIAKDPPTSSSSTPLQTDGVAAVLLMSSNGRSSYKNVEFGFQYTTGTTADHERDVRPLDWAERFQRVLELFRRDAAAGHRTPTAYAPASTDVPHRLFARDTSC